MTTHNVIRDWLAGATILLRGATHHAEHLAETGNGERVQPDAILGGIQDLSLKISRLLIAAEQDALRQTADVRSLARRDRITYELLHTAGAAALQFQATLHDVVDEIRTLP